MRCEEGGREVVEEEEEGERQKGKGMRGWVGLDLDVKKTEEPESL